MSWMDQIIMAKGGSGGGGGGSGAEPLVVTVTQTYDPETYVTTFTADKSYNDVKNAILAGKLVLFVTEYSYEEDGVTYTTTNIEQVMSVGQTLSSDHSWDQYSVQTYYAQYQPIDNDPDKNLYYDQQ